MLILDVDLRVFDILIQSYLLSIKLHNDEKKERHFKKIFLLIQYETFLKK